MTKPTIYTKQALIAKLKEISAMGFILNARKGNHGGIGNTLEDLLGIEENNLPIPNAAEWELKAQRLNSTSLTTLFHMEPSPRGFVLFRKSYFHYMVGRIKKMVKNIQKEK